MPLEFHELPSYISQVHHWGDPVALLQIKAAVLRADEDARTDYDSPQRAHPESHYRWSTADDVAHRARHQAVRDKSDELRVDPAAYFRAEPAAVEDCTLSCLSDWPEIRVVADQADPGDLHLTIQHETIHHELQVHGVSDEESVAITQGPRPEDIDDSYLDEEPLLDDLGSGLGSGY